MKFTAHLSSHLKWQRPHPRRRVCDVFMVTPSFPGSRHLMEGSFIFRSICKVDDSDEHHQHSILGGKPTPRRLLRPT